MKRLVCRGCGLAEDLNNPSGNIHPVQLVDVAPIYDTPGAGPDQVVEEDLCGDCRKAVRRQFFGIEEAELLEMPLMRAGG